MADRLDLNEISGKLESEFDVTPAGVKKSVLKLIDELVHEK